MVGPGVLDSLRVDEAPYASLSRIGTVFATFGRETQGSGNISYGVQVGDERFFCKTAGVPDEEHATLPHPDRVALLANAVRVAEDVRHPTRPELLRVLDSAYGPMLVYAWVDGELLRSPPELRQDPASAERRFRRLPIPRILGCLDALFDLHERLAAAGRIAVDFYDGCLIYDFDSGQLSVVDLDNYHVGPFRNERGRMFGSTRFMAPEEFEKGARIDERTNVFTMGRSVLLYLGDGTRDPAGFFGPRDLFDVAARACEPRREERYGSMADFCQAWRTARART